MDFTSSHGLRIWRTTGSVLYTDEASVASAQSDATLARIADEGFNAIWVHTLLYSIMNSKVLPQLNDPAAAARIASLRVLIQRAAKHGIAVYLYINDPQAIDEKHRLWAERPKLKGHAFSFGSSKHYSLCTALPDVRAFVNDAARSVIDALPGLGGIILITACEHPTHCWSKAAIRMGGAPTNCVRCKDREPAESVLPILEAWANAAKNSAQPPRILAWNWEWAYWYDDPQTPISTQLPDGVELLLDNEIGSHAIVCGKPRVIREYSLAKVGPSERFVATSKAVAAAGKRTPVHAKVEFNATHEMCSVPNVPVLATIHTRLRRMRENGIAGFLGCWSMSCGLTLNTAALRVFLSDPNRYMDADLFFEALAADYFGAKSADGFASSWRHFSQAWTHYPNALPLLYTGPHNDAPGRKMSSFYEGKPMGRSWQMDEPGDNLSTSLGKPEAADSLSLDDVIKAYSQIAQLWITALPEYEAAILGCPQTNEIQRKHQAEELGVAKMIGIQLLSTSHAFEFHRARLRIMAQRGWSAPCLTPIDDGMAQVMRKEIAVIERAIPLVVADARLGYHFDCGTYKYNVAMIEKKIEAMHEELNCR